MLAYCLIFLTIFFVFCEWSVGGGGVGTHTNLPFSSFEREVDFFCDNKRVTSLNLSGEEEGVRGEHTTQNKL